ncbi:hypothetical protein CKK34_5201 [Yarrowia sp. E02]|nr:hypothetical protein CKK34_5201 [Yarrowia sp. E02]
MTDLQSFEKEIAASAPHPPLIENVTLGVKFDDLMQWLNDFAATKHFAFKIGRKRKRKSRDQVTIITSLECCRENCAYKVFLEEKEHDGKPCGLHSLSYDIQMRPHNHRFTEPEEESVKIYLDEVRDTIKKARSDYVHPGMPPRMNCRTKAELWRKLHDWSKPQAFAFFSKPLRSNPERGTSSHIFKCCVKNADLEECDYTLKVTESEDGWHVNHKDVSTHNHDIGKGPNKWMGQAEEQRLLQDPDHRELHLPPQGIYESRAALEDAIDKFTDEYQVDSQRFHVAWKTKSQDKRKGRTEVVACHRYYSESWGGSNCPVSFVVREIGTDGRWMLQYTSIGVNHNHPSAQESINEKWRQSGGREGELG